MAWCAPRDAEVAALIGTRIDGVGVGVDERDAPGCRGAVA